MRVIGRAIKEFYHIEQGQPLKVRILQNDKQVWPEQDWAVVPLNDRTGITHNLILNVAQGDQLRFVLAPGTEPENDILVWMPNIEYLEENVAYPSVIVRILCGAKEAYTDRNGNVWSEDRYFEDGSRVKSDAVLTAGIPALDDNKLYQYGREGKDFTYSIPVPAGLYCLRLKFAENEYENFFERPFNLSINGKQVLRNFDICHAARGPRRSYDRLFRYLVPNGDGRIVLHFTEGWEPLMESGKALVQAIELTPEIKPAIRINAGSDTPFVDWNSYTWSGDAHYEGGSVITSDKLVEHASPTLYDQSLYQTARTGKTLRYAFAVTPGLYNVHLKFAELWLSEPGQRPMDIAINGRTLWSAWDPATAANKIARAAEIRAQDITPNADGQITIQITASGSNDAILQGIEIE
ncbi:MAG: Di-glucose binding within endoplasmic reticulum [Planctomycetes bacterium ADurb.Bin412]|nr:MAG: Di-glucose binding within endoplasmic reticulum [Planctomycetes bacterium ADurb.Bin412]